ncbi:MAG: UvrD-helicase domain-containing protein [Vicingaceae bacterium]
MSLKVYKSSAGSGKTFTLVKEYLKLCLQSEEDYYFASILAITFTNKATAEMKERILKHLKITAAGNGEEDVMGHIIAEECNLPYEKLQQRAKRSLSAILHGYGDFSISTIDRFTHRLVRTFARDLGLSVNFNVLLDHEEIMHKTIASIIDEAGKSEEVTELLQSFLAYRVESDKSWKIEKSLLDFSKTLINENAYFYLAENAKVSTDDFHKSIKKLKATKSQFQSKLQAIGNKGLSLIERADLNHSDFYQSAFPKYFTYLSQFRADRLQPNSHLRKTLEEDKWYSSKCAATAKADIDEIKSELIILVEQAIDVLENGLTSYISAKAILQNIYNLQLAKLIDQRFSKLKKEEQVLHISDFNKKIAEVVLREPMPFIYERLGDRYRNLMIDEFQDTSILQFINLLPLIDESLSAGKFNMLVGDAKQAIYRFRGGESEQFSQLPEIDHLYKEHHALALERLQNIKGHYEEDRLAMNRRSSYEVVNFNNAFFEFAYQHPILEAKGKQAFEMAKQEIPEDAEKGEGYVEVNLFESDEEVEEQLERLYEIIKKALNDQYQLQDIAILCRWNKEASKVAEFLKSKEIEVLSSEALLLKNSAKVQFLIALMKWCLDSKSEQSRIQIIEYLCLDATEIEKAEHLEKYAPIDKDLQNFMADKGYEIVVSDLLKLDLFAFFENLIRTFHLAEPFDHYVQFLQEYTFDFSRQEGNHFEDFLDYWERNEDKLSLDLSAEVDAVKILTIHKSKGLEFPITLVPFLKQEANLNARNFRWVKVPQELDIPLAYALIYEIKEFLESHFNADLNEELIKKQEDLLNDNYVAFTRAVERLYLLAPKAKRSKASINYLLSQFVKEHAGEENKCSFGVERIKEEDKGQDLEKPALQIKYRSKDWRDRIRISSELTAFYDEEAKAEAIDYGNLMHDVLAELEDESQLEKVLNRMYLKGRIDASQKTEMKAKLIRLLNLKEVKPYFEKGVKSYREAMLMSKDGKRIRPDRIVELSNGSKFVLEFKTGKATDSHQKQLEEYVALLKEIKQSKVNGALLYIEEEKLLPLT